MKKKKYLLFSLTLFSLFFLYHNVNATTKCSYYWNGETIILEKEDDSDTFDKIVTNMDISIADDNTLKETEGLFTGKKSCPVVAFSHDTILGNKMYDSMTKCINRKGTLFDSCTEIQGTLLEGDNSSENIVGKSQAALVDRGDTFCIYESGDRYRFTVTAEDRRYYDPDLKCKDQQDPFCTLKSNDRRFFYNAGDDKIKCPSYIYYECKIGYGLISSFTNKCSIIGTGGDSDKNYSDANNPIKGDEPVTVNPPLEIEQGPLDCDKMFQGPFGDFLKGIWNLIKFAVPILIIALSIMDFVKSISAQDEAEIKKAANKLVKRLVIGVLIFVLPTIIELLLHLAGIEYGTCNIK